MLVSFQVPAPVQHWWLPSTLSETSTGAKAQLHEQRCLDLLRKSDLGAGRLRCTMCLTVQDSPDHAAGEGADTCH